MLRTVFLAAEHVSAYLADFAGRLRGLKSEMPLVWCPLGPSGEAIAAQLLKHFPSEDHERIQIVYLHYDRNTGTIKFEEAGAPEALSNVGRVLVLDSSVHSGATMLCAARTLRTCGVQRVCSYSLVLKRGSEFVPNFFGVAIDDHDRALFMLHEIPNNRLMPFGVVRRLSQEDVRRVPQNLDCGLPSISKMTWGDFFYDVARGSHVFVYEDMDMIKALISFDLREGAELIVDAVAADRTCQGQGLGGHLMRWAETCARHARCQMMKLWAIEDGVGFYKRLDYEEVGEQLDLGDEQYRLMRRRLLYNLPEEDN